MATTPFAPPVPSPLFGSNYGPVTPQTPVLLATPQQLTANAAAFASVFIQPVNALWLYMNIVGFSGSDQLKVRFNADAGANYWHRNVTVAAGAAVITANADVVSTNQILIGLAGTTALQILATVGNPSATAAVSKVLRANVAQGTGAAGTAGVGYIFNGGEWVNTANPINRIDVSVLGANNFLAGSSLEVWGCV